MSEPGERPFLFNVFVPNMLTVGGSLPTSGCLAGPQDRSAGSDQGSGTAPVVLSYGDGSKPGAILEPGEPRCVFGVLTHIRWPMIALHHQNAMRMILCTHQIRSQAQPF